MKKNSLVKDAKDTMKVGTLTMVGGSALGSIGAVSGMPVPAAATAGLNLVNVGQLSKTSMNLLKNFKFK